MSFSSITHQGLRKEKFHARKSFDERSRLARMVLLPSLTNVHKVEENVFIDHLYNSLVH